nr:glycoside hydrolase family 20 zincin-like fold domain-containing protein [Bacilli bacterium]
MKNKSFLLIFPMLATMLAGCGGSKTTVSIRYEGNEGPVNFAIEEIKDAFGRNNLEFVESDGEYQIEFASLDSNLGEQAYKVKVNDKKITITGGDNVGAMYGGLQVAENINLEDGITNMQDASGSPYIKMRGVRTRLVTDLRTPCYINNGN